MKKIIILIFLTFFITAPAFAQTHRLKKRQKGKVVKNHHATSKTKVRKKKKKHVRKHVAQKRVVKTVYKKTHKRHKRVHRPHHVYKTHSYKRVIKHHRPAHRVHRRVVHVHHEHCGHHYDHNIDVFEDNFVMPSLSCPYRTHVVSSGNTQWCETRRGVRHGPYKRWNSYGGLRASGHYHYDTKHGAWTEYHTNGYVSREIEYDGGHRSGTWSSWDRHGVSLSVILY